VLHLHHQIQSGSKKVLMNPTVHALALPACISVASDAQFDQPIPVLQVYTALRSTGTLF
jgi:hypothetical protein